MALDFDAEEQAIALAKQLSPEMCRLKVGKELFTRAGPRVVERLQDLGYDIFLDLKFHDIPNTVAKAVKVAADLGVWMVNVHASGGREMLSAARKAIGDGAGRPRLISVTVLTSMEAEDLLEMGFNRTPQQLVTGLAQLSQECGLDGVVCSAREVELLRNCLGNDFLLVTPGIRPAGSDPGDQKRILTPKDAIAAGSDYLVIGRPITQSADPAATLGQIYSDITDS